MVENDHFVKAIDLEGVTILPVRLGDYISEIEQELSPRYIMTLSLKFEEGIVIYFQTGELSIFAEDTHKIKKIAIDLLNHFGFKGPALFNQLKSYKHFYISVSQSGEFEYLFPHP